jgi:post-segregation antitoxin (ccd killing protein)
MASITVRISDEPKKELQDSGVKISEVTRKAIRAEVERIQEQRAR